MPSHRLTVGGKEIPGFLGRRPTKDVGQEVIAGQNKSFPQNISVTLIRYPLRPASVFLLTGWFMRHRFDVARGRDIVTRWCALAEQRLEYLTELFETGRWRRFHSELAFLENIQEAKTAVEIWRDLSMREANCDNSAVDISWLGRNRTALPRGER